MRSGDSQKRETCSLPSGSLLSSTQVSVTVNLEDTLKCDAQFPVPAITREMGGASWKGRVRSRALKPGGGVEGGVGSSVP